MRSGGERAPTPARLVEPSGKPVRSPQANAPERREHERVEIERAATLYFKDGSATIEGTAVNISRGGIAVACDHLPKIGDRFGLKINLQVDGRITPLLATVVVRDVVHIGAPPYLRIGFQFTRFHSGTELSLTGFLNEKLGLFDY